MTAATGLVVAWCLGVIVYDLSVRRIPNLFGLIALAGTVLAFALTGHSVLGASWPAVLLGLVCVLALGLPGYALHWLGMGDVKLLLSIALLGGWDVALVSFVVGAVLAALVALCILTIARSTGYPMSARRWIPFGAALSIGLLLSIWSRA